MTFRADRKTKTVHRSGVFSLARRDDLRCNEQPEFKADCELICVKLEVTGSHPLYIGAYYKQTDLILLDFSKAFDKVNHSYLIYVPSLVTVHSRALLGAKSCVRSL